MRILKEKTKKKQEKGITLIALVITIIVLLILAGVSVRLALGDDGIIAETKKTKENAELVIHGRHDPCIVPRAVPVIEAVTAIAIINLM